MCAVRFTTLTPFMTLTLINTPRLLYITMGLSKHDIIELGLKGIGKTRVQGDTTEPAMPFLLGDIMVQHYLRATSKIKLTHELKKIDTLWRKDYNLFNRPFFAHIPAYYNEDVTDMMDSLTEYISNEITMLKAGTMSMFEGIDFEQRQIASDFMLAHIFAQFAQAAWGNTYNTIKGHYFGYRLERETNQILQRLRDNSFRMCMAYIKSLPGNGEVTISNPNSDKVFTIIAKKIYNWLKTN